MRSTFSLLLYINRNKVRADGTTSILCRISIDGKNTVITTGISCKPQQWNAKNAETSDARTNNRLKKFRSNAERLYENLLGSISAIIDTEPDCTLSPIRLQQSGCTTQFRN